MNECVLDRVSDSHRVPPGNHSLRADLVTHLLVFAAFFAIGIMTLLPAVI